MSINVIVDAAVGVWVVEDNGVLAVDVVVVEVVVDGFIDVVGVVIIDVVTQEPQVREHKVGKKKTAADREAESGEKH